jgi:hypothetical protein
VHLFTMTLSSPRMDYIGATAVYTEGPLLQQPYPVTPGRWPVRPKHVVRYNEESAFQ